VSHVGNAWQQSKSGDQRQERPVQQWLNRFFDSYYHHRPVNATFVGLHDFDHRLPDCSARGVADVLTDADQLLREGAALDDSQMDAMERLDKRLAEGFLRIQKWEYQSAHFQKGNPSYYTGEALFGVIGLFLTEFAPAEERAAAAIDRMQSVGMLLEQCRDNVRSAPVQWTERAKRECLGARALFGTGIDLWAAEHGVTDQTLRRAADQALAAFRRFEDYLDSDVRAAADASMACGGEAFEMLTREGHGLTIGGDEIAAYAAEKLEETQRLLNVRAAEMGVHDWQEALSQLSDIHPTTAEYLGRYQQMWDASRALAEQERLLTWPDFPIEYVPQPEWAREAAPFLYFLFYRAPAAFNRPPVHPYLVTPIEVTMPPAEQERRLRATNDSVIKLNHVVHHGGIGHHVQNWNAYQSKSRIGRMAAVDCASRIAMFCGGTMAEGWACYATTLMGESGFLTSLETFSEMQTDLRMAARAIVDVRLHQQQMTFDEAVEFYERNTGMSRDASYAEAAKNSMFPGAALIYLSGRDSILELREQQRRKLGSQFDLQGFHDRFLSYGSIPVQLIAEAMNERADDAE
jgi:uncharacterized protein (DUF885 family)